MVKYLLLKLKFLRVYRFAPRLAQFHYLSDFYFESSRVATKTYESRAKKYVNLYYYETFVLYGLVLNSPALQIFEFLTLILFFLGVEKIVQAIPVRLLHLLQLPLRGAVQMIALPSTVVAATHLQLTAGTSATTLPHLTLHHPLTWKGIYYFL